MKGHKLIICAIGAAIAIVAAVTAIVIFRNEITEFFMDMRERVEKVSHKVLRRNGEYADYADV